MSLTTEEAETAKRLEALKFASNMVCSGRTTGLATAIQVTSIADAFYLFLNGTPATVAPPTFPPNQVRAKEGTLFVFDGKTVEIIRSDQPICRIPISDFKEFVSTQDTPF